MFNVKVPVNSPAGILNLLTKSIFLKDPVPFLSTKTKSPAEFKIISIGLSILASFKTPSTVPESFWLSIIFVNSPSLEYLYM